MFGGSAPVLTSDNTVLLTEHFSKVLNLVSRFTNDIIYSLPQRAILALPNFELCLLEVTKAIKPLSFGKSPGFDGIPFVRKLTKLFQNIWDQGEVLQGYKDDSILH